LLLILKNDTYETRWLVIVTLFKQGYSYTLRLQQGEERRPLRSLGTAAKSFQKRFVRASDHRATDDRSHFQLPTSFCRMHDVSGQVIKIGRGGPAAYTSI
jgi:hypothetical protein